jgi:cellulose synthase (UDP-forming)
MIKFKVTPKDNITRNKFAHKYRLVWIQIVLAIFSFVGISNLIYNLITKAFEFSLVINLFWLFYNFYLLIMAIFFASERPKFRTGERIFIEADIKIQNDNYRIYDISESGISFYKQLNDNFAIKDIITIEIKNEKYKVSTLGEIVYITTDKCAVKFKDINEENYKQLILLLYDRVPFNPEVICENNLSEIKNILKTKYNYWKKT